jgi:murein DD-endopeptidase MepM/ murein hydrolase activator NlpD
VPHALHSRHTRPIAAIAVALALVGGALLGSEPAAAASYPSWPDVLAARGQESATRTRVAQLQTALTGLRDRANAATAEAERLGTAYQRAQEQATRAAERESRLRSEAESHAAQAAESAEHAGRLAAQLSKTGAHRAARLLTDGSDATDLLYDLGAISRLGAQTEQVEQAAAADAATARSLIAQADRASDALDAAAQEAASQMASAQAASDAAQALVTEQQDNEARLEAQLATLTSGRVRTEAEFQKGEAARRAAEEAARRAAAEAAAGSGSRPGGGSGGGGAGSGGGSGWVRPGGGSITSVYGYRVNPVTGAWAFHDGIDLGSGCSTAIVAATAGTVEYVGWFGGYGNYVRIDHGGGVKTAYGHIVHGGFRVTKGQRVSAGQLVALVGSTGNSTGCHLHYETHVGSSTTNPVPFMAARGVSLG